MSAITARQLLTAVESVSPRDHRRLIAETAFAAAADGLVEPMLAELDATDSWGRQIALQIAGVLRHRNYIRHCLDSVESQLALRAWPKAIRHAFVDPAEISGRLQDLPSEWRKIVLKSIRRQRARQLADALIAPLRARFGDAEAAPLLPTCSVTIVRELLPELAYAVRNWDLLARRHPATVLDYFRDRLANTPRASWRFIWSDLQSAMSELSKAAPRDVLELFEAGEGEFAVPGKVAATLARNEPLRTLKILVDPRYQGPSLNDKPFFSAVRDLGDADLISFVRTLRGVNVNRFLAALAPSRRTAIFDCVIQNKDLPAAGLTIPVLDELPRAGRASQARRLLAFRSGSDNPETRLQLVARLEWADAQRELREATARPAAEDRSVAYRLLIKAAGLTRDPQVLQQTLQSLTRLVNEQDPVRLAALETLAALPVHLFTDESAAAVQQLSSDAIHARDCSWGTRDAIGRLTARMLVEGSQTARNLLVSTATTIWEQLGETQSVLSFGPLYQQLPVRGEHHLFAALERRIAVDAKRGLFDIPLALGESLRRRAWQIPGLQTVLGEATGAKADGVVRRAIDLWLADPAHRSERVEVVVRRDPSTITLTTVRNALAASRTDLLVQILGRKISGRFLGGKARHVPIFDRPTVGRWSPTVQQVYRNLLADCAAGARLPAWERTNALHALAALRGSAGVIRGFLADPEIMIAEAALSALTWTEEPGAVLPEILARVAGPQARVAMYSATRCARFVRPSQLSIYLWPVLTGEKITSRKEAVRLLAAHHVPDAVDLLVAVWRQPEQHRDVRRAVAANCLTYLDSEPAWQLLAEAAADDAVATVLVEQQPYQIPDRHRTRYARLLVQITASGVPATRIAATAALGRWSRWDGGVGRQVLVHRLTDLSDTALWRHALRAIVDGAGQTGDCAGILVAAAELMKSGDPLTPVGDRDQPARQRLIAIADSLSSDAVNVRFLLPGAADLADRLAADTTLGGSVVKLAVASIDWTTSSSALVAGVQQTVGLAAQVDQAAATAGFLRAWLGNAINLQTAQWLLPVATQLAAQPEEAASLIGLAIVEVTGRHMDWPPAWLEVLSILRRHSQSRTRVSALNVFVRRE